MTSSRLTELFKLEISGFKMGWPELAKSPVVQRTGRFELVVILTPTLDLVANIIQ